MPSHERCSARPQLLLLTLCVHENVSINVGNEIMSVGLRLHFHIRMARNHTLIITAAAQHNANQADPTAPTRATKCQRITNPDDAAPSVSQMSDEQRQKTVLDTTKQKAHLVLAPTTYNKRAWESKRSQD